MRSVLFFGILAFLVCYPSSGGEKSENAIANRVRLIGPTGEIPYASWKKENESKEMAVQGTETVQLLASSFFLLSGTEEPHLHAEHDLSLTLLEGQASIHFEERAHPLHPGDTVLIPKQTVHWMENTGETGAVFHMVITPVEWNDDTVIVKPTSEKNEGEVSRP